jgi:hypothetical protein
MVAQREEVVVAARRDKSPLDLLKDLNATNAGKRI